MDFRFWILDYGTRDDIKRTILLDFSSIQNPKSLHFFVFRIHVFARQGDTIILRLFLRGDEKIGLCLQKIGAVVNRQLKIITVCDGVFRTGLDAESAKDTAAVIDVVNLRVALVATDAFFVRPGIGLRFDIDTVRRAGRGTEVTCDTLFLTHLIDVQEMLPAIARLDGDRNIRILNRPLLARDVG